MKKIISRQVPFQPYYLFCISEDIYALFIHNGAERFNGKLFMFRAAVCRPKKNCISPPAKVQNTLRRDEFHPAAPVFLLFYVFLMYLYYRLFIFNKTI